MNAREKAAIKAAKKLQEAGTQPAPTVTYRLSSRRQAELAQHEANMAILTAPKPQPQPEELPDDTDIRDGQ